MAVNRPKVIKTSHTLSDRIASVVTGVAGSIPFLIANLTLFGSWLLINSGVFGERYVVDEFPFSFLTMTVSIEAIVLSIFVIMSQRRQAKVTEIRTELDYRADLQAEVDIKTIVSILQRLATTQGVNIDDLVTEMKAEEKLADDASSFN